MVNINCKTLHAIIMNHALLFVIHYPGANNPTYYVHQPPIALLAAQKGRVVDQQQSNVQSMAHASFRVLLNDHVSA